MPLTSDEDISQLLIETKTIALVGASPKSERPSHRVMKFLLDHGYDVYPVNPGQAGKTIHDREVFATLDDLPASIDMVDVFRQSRFVAGIVADAIRLEAKSIWTQLDIVDEEAAKNAEDAGLKVVMDRCPAIEIPRLQCIGVTEGT